MQFNISYKYQSIYKEKNYGGLLEAKIVLRKKTTFTYIVVNKRNYKLLNREAFGLGNKIYKLTIYCLTLKEFPRLIIYFALYYM